MKKRIVKSPVSRFDLRRLSWMWRESPAKLPSNAPGGLPWPRLSIITPSYNQGRFLEETIRSVLFQGYPNLEYIVIDGGSSDDSVEVIRKYQDQLFYWVSERDGGQAHAVNKGLEKATGDIVGWINSDDVYTSRAFVTAISRFITSTEVGLVYGWRILIDEDTRVSGWVPNYPFNPQATGYNICSETAFWRPTPDDPRLREDLKFAMDLDFFVRLFHSRRSVHCNTFLGCFRCYSANKSSTIQDVGRQEAIKIWEAKYGIGHAAWTKHQAIGRSRAIQSLVTSPKAVAIPYIYRRVFLGKRGL